MSRRPPRRQVVPPALPEDDTGDPTKPAGQLPNGDWVNCRHYVPSKDVAKIGKVVGPAPHKHTT
jgi:hypothetical protein